MTDGCELFQAADGHYVPMLTLESGIRHLGSCYDGRHAANVWLDHYVSARTENLFLFGMGDCQIILAAMERVPGYIVVFEPEERIYKETRTTSLYKKLLKSRRLLIFHGIRCYNELAKCIKQILDEDWVERTLLVCHPGYHGLYEEHFQKMERICQEVCDDITLLRSSLKRFGKRMVRNQIYNIPQMEKGILVARLARSWNRDIPVIVVAAGPSLEKNVELLKNVKGRALIFCADSALPTLFKRDIIPDVVGGVDAGKNMDCYLDERCRKIPHFVTTNSSLKFMESGEGVKIWGYDDEFVQMLFAEASLELPQIPFYMGVATALFATLTELGTRHIILVGQDLAYSSEGKSHVTGRDEAFLRDENYKAEGYYGGEVYSRLDWMETKKWFEKMLQIYPDLNVTDATEGGVYISGTKRQPLKEVLDCLPELSTGAGEYFHQLLADGSCAISKAEYEKLLEGYFQCKNDLQQLKQWGYHKTFFEEDYRRIPIMQMVMGYMKSLDDEREIRFETALEFIQYQLERGEERWKISRDKL